MHSNRTSVRVVLGLSVLLVAGAAAQTNVPWPPALPGAVHGTVTVSSPLFLKVPDGVMALTTNAGAAPFVMAKTPPNVDLAFHGSLPDAALNGTGWSAWGDICIASNGNVYAGIGDHGPDAEGRSHAYIYRWDPAAKTLEQIVDVNAVVPRREGEPTWSKIHARIDEGPDGGIYFTGTLNDGNSAGNPKFKWSKAVPGGQLYRYDPGTGRAEVYVNLPPARATATSLLDRQRNIWWCYIEAGRGLGLFGLDLATKKPVFQSPDGVVGHNRNFALARDGALYFNGTNAIWKYDPATRSIAPTRSAFPSKDHMRSSTRESKDGWIYGVTLRGGQLFRYAPAKDTLQMLGPDFLKGNYTTVIELSPDERFLYYLPGAHGGAVKIGTTVLQYEIATGRRKVLAFLGEGMERACRYVPGGTYGAKIGPAGDVLYVNFNGHAADAIRPKEMRPTGFGLTAFAAIHIPESER
jgi:sugar lactone lactonase YvrE